MRISIRKLQFAMFRGSAYYLDLDTGETLSAVLINDGIEEMPKRCIRLPMYSTAPIYQGYLDMLFAQNRIKDPYGLSLFPKFGIEAYDSPEDLRNGGKAEYIDKAYYFVIDLENGRHRSDGTESELPSFSAFYSSYTHRIALDWCVEEGFEWFDEPDFAR